MKLAIDQYLRTELAIAEKNHTAFAKCCTECPGITRTTHQNYRKMEHPLTERIRKWCNYQERCSSQLEKKLRSMLLTPEDRERLYQQMHDEQFVDDRRFTESFVRGKIRLKQWGKVKVRFGLKELQLPQYLITEFIDLFPDEEYIEIVDQLIERKYARIAEEDEYTKRGKIAQFLAQRGFEQEIIWKRMDVVLRNKSL